VSNAELGFLGELETIVQARLATPTKESYTSKLAAAGVKRIAQKVGEEGVELALAAVSGDREEIVNEAADLLYHLTVLLAERDLGLADVAARLQQRHAARS
jgi:phosphoribosyl-ATP pyrophosphohydrolase/phosphoribosyl-AMP cyclohydrolase